MGAKNIPNESGQEVFMIAPEVTPGVFVTPTRKMTQKFNATPGRGDLITGQDATGRYNRTAKARRGFKTPSGTFGGDGALTYQELALLSPYFIRGGVTGTSDGATVPGYTYNFSPNPTADDIQTLSALFGVEGQVWQATGVRFDEINITGDATGSDDNWKISGTPFMKEVKRSEGFEGALSTVGTITVLTMSSAGWTVNAWVGAFVFVNYGSGVGEVRQVLSNTATALTLADPLSSAPASGTKFYISRLYPTIADPTYDVISMEGTKIYLDVYNSGSSSLGTTNVSDRVASFGVNQKLNLASKRRASGVIARLGRGDLVISGNLRFENDRWDEYAKWMKDELLSIRIEKEGPIIDTATSSRHLAQINIEKAIFNARTEDTDNHNKMVNLTFVALVNTPDWNLKIKTNLANLS